MTKSQRYVALGYAGTIASTVAVIFLMKSFAFASNYIPSESMVPTLEIGDQLFVSRWPYGISRHSLAFDPGFSLPGPNGRLFAKMPKRGDVVTFAHPMTEETMVKRLIGLPGDSIALRHGRLIINGEMAARTEVSQFAYRAPQGDAPFVTQYIETLPGGVQHAIIERGDEYAADNMDEVTVPEGMLFMMGDNRDNSADSRFDEMGFVPLENLQGRVEMITWSLYNCQEEPGLACAHKRFLSPID